MSITKREYVEIGFNPKVQKIAELVTCFAELQRELEAYARKGYELCDTRGQEYSFTLDRERPSRPGSGDEDANAELLSRSVGTLALPRRPLACLANAKIETIGQLVSKREIDLLKLKNFGRKSLNDVRSALGEHRLMLCDQERMWV